MILGLMNYKLYVQYDIFSGVYTGEIDSNEKSEMMIDTTNMTDTFDIDKFEYVQFQGSV